MAENTEHLGTTTDETLVEKLSEKISEKLSKKIHGGDGGHDVHHSSSSSSSSSSSDSESEKAEKVSPSATVKSKIYQIFGREKKPVHHVLGGGKAADVFLWRNKKTSAGVLGGATAIWVLFELLEYHLLTLVCHILILTLAVLFLWANVTKFINRSPPHIPDVHLPEDTVLQVASAVRIEINGALAVLRDIASGRNLKEFLVVIAGLWVLSIVGRWCNFLTLFYITFVLLHTVPVLYEKYAHKIDPFAEKAMIEIKKQYAVFDAKVLSKLPRGPLKNKKT